MGKVPSHLDHLPTWHGLPVPFVNIWSDEEDEHAMVHGPDATVGRDGWFATGKQGKGEPNFKRQCPQRQRLSAVYGLCQVCWTKLGPGPRNLLVMASKARTVDGVEGVLLAEPWICNLCLPYVQRACPAVRREKPQHIRVKQWTLSVEMQWHDDYGPDVAAAMWVNVLLPADLFGVRRPAGPAR